MTQLKIALEWFINPDHLPFIVGVEKGFFKDAGIDLQIIEPKEHYDGFEELKSGEIDIHCNEPLHLFEHYFSDIKSLGCFFETRGGVMIRADRVEKLKSNQPINITTPAANSVTDKIGFEILSRYAKKEGFALDRKNVNFIQKDFWHIDNMKKDESLDGAWLCFYNFEGIEAEFEKFENLFIDQNLSPYPNFSALELMSTQQVIDEKGEALCKFIEQSNKAAQYCKDNIKEVKDIYYSYTKTEPTELMDRIIEDTIPRFEVNIKADNQRWQNLYRFLEKLDITALKNEEYENIWAVKGH